MMIRGGGDGDGDGGPFVVVVKMTLKVDPIVCRKGGGHAIFSFPQHCASLNRHVEGRN